jgi:hypothetical protein
MDLALILASSTNHHLFSSLDGQPQIGWLSIFRDKFIVYTLDSREAVESSHLKIWAPLSLPLWKRGLGGFSNSKLWKEIPPGPPFPKVGILALS